MEACRPSHSWNDGPISKVRKNHKSRIINHSVQPPSYYPNIFWAKQIEGYKGVRLKNTHYMNLIDRLALQTTDISENN